MYAVQLSIHLIKSNKERFRTNTDVQNYRISYKYVCIRGETGMVKIELEMDKPKECHECPFQLKFKDDTVDDWYMRRCVIINQIIEYPLPDWCPIKEV